MRRKIAIFDVLGVSPEDDITTIRLAWRRKVKELHPDIAEDKKAAGALLARINAAFGELQNHQPFKERRRANRRSAQASRRLWTEVERSKAKRQRDDKDRARAAEAARRQAKGDAAAKKWARDVLRRQSSERAKPTSRHSQSGRRFSKQERTVLTRSIQGYTAARSAIAV